MGEERADRVPVEVFEEELRRCLPGPVVNEPEEQPEAVAVGSDGVGAGVALADEPLGEEPL